LVKEAGALIAATTVEALRHVFVWPDLPPREKYEKAWGEHQAILDRGHLYMEKTNYVRRIVAAVYSTWPEVQGRGRVSLLAGYRETGACLKEPRLRDWTRIVTSNTHFGRVIRGSGVTEEEFREALVAPDLLPLAARLGTSVRELASLLSDIRSCDGHRYGGRWIGDLLDYKLLMTPKYGPASGRNTVATWREYAGARTRASKAKAVERASRSGRDDPTLDDYFGWSELPRPAGWEVQLNADFTETLLEEYLASFATLMADRERTDWDSYRRLLTGYIGVQTDGQIGEWTKPRNCLRAVMLGYLKSHEVIAGGDCRSCSFCVSEGDLDKYTVEQRREVVVRMSARAEELFEQVEQASAEFPDVDAIPALLAEIKAEEERGRSLVRYFEGWSARLLEDEPEHRAGILARIHVMKAGLVPVDGSELGSLASRLRRLLTAEATPVVWDAVSDLHGLAPGEAETYLIQTAVKRTAGDNRGVLAATRVLLEATQAGTISPSAAEMSEVWLRVRELCAADGTLPDAALFREATIALARVSDDWRVSRDLYAEVFGSDLRGAESSAEIEEELQTLGATKGRPSAAPVLGLLSVWIEIGGEGSRAERTRDVARWLEAHEGLLDALSVSAGAAGLAAVLDQGVPVEYPLAAVWAARCAVAGEEATTASASAGARLAVRTLSTGSHIDQETAEHLVRWVGQSEDVARVFRTSLLDDQLNDEERGSVLETVLADPQYDSWTTLDRWLELVEISPSFSTRPAAVLGLVRSANSLCMAHPRGAETCLSEQASSATLERLQTLVVSSLREHEKSREAHGELVSMLAAFPPSLAEYVEMCLTDERVPSELAEDGFMRLVATGDRSSILALLRSIRGRPSVDLPQILRQAFRLFEALQGLFNTAGTHLFDRPESSEIAVLWSSLTPEARVEDADLFVTGIHELRKEWNPAWMTPVAQEVEALVMARRYQEAEELAGKHPELTLGSDRRVAADWIAQARTWGEPRFAPSETTVLSQVASCVIEDFKARLSTRMPVSGVKSNGRLKKVGRSIGKWISGGA
jgi:hypothetical protein